MTTSERPAPAPATPATSHPTTPPGLPPVDRAPARAAAIREITEGVSTLAARQRCAVARRVHHSGISLGHLQILWILQEHGPLPVNRLADMLGIGAPNATGLLDRMVQRGLIDRSRDVDDRRIVLVRQTALGRETAGEMDGWRPDWIEHVLAPLPDEQLEALAASVRATIASGDFGVRAAIEERGDCADGLVPGIDAVAATAALVAATAPADNRFDAAHTAVGGRR